MSWMDTFDTESKFGASHCHWQAAFHSFWQTRSEKHDASAQASSFAEGSNFLKAQPWMQLHVHQFLATASLALNGTEAWVEKAAVGRMRPQQMKDEAETLLAPPEVRDAMLLLLLKLLLEGK